MGLGLLVAGGLELGLEEARRLEFRSARAFRGRRALRRV